MGRHGWYWRTYYEANRQAWPHMPKLVAAWDAFKLAWRVRWKGLD